MRTLIALAAGVLLLSVAKGTAGGASLAADVGATGQEPDGDAHTLSPDGSGEAREEAPLLRQINDALDEMDQDGTVEELKKKHFPDSEQPDG